MRRHQVPQDIDIDIDQWEDMRDNSPASASHTSNGVQEVDGCLGT